MADLAHVWGSDLSWAPNGDLAMVDGSAEGQQRVLRRVLTPRLGYVWQPTYGGGVPELVGSLASPQAVEGAVRSQMLQEDAVSQLPPPVVVVTPIDAGQNISVRYVDSLTGQSLLLAFAVT